MFYALKQWFFTCYIQTKEAAELSYTCVNETMKAPFKKKIMLFIFRHSLIINFPTRFLDVYFVSVSF